MQLNRFIFSLMQIKQKIRRNTYEQEFQAIVCSASSRDWHHRIKFQGFIFFLNLPFSASNMPAGSGTAQLNSISQIAGKQKQIAPKCSIAVMIHDSGNSKQLFHSSDKKWPLSKKKKKPWTPVAPHTNTHGVCSSASASPSIWVGLKCSGWTLPSTSPKTCTSGEMITGEPQSATPIFQRHCSSEA